MIAYLAFTAKGYSLAQRLASVLGGHASRCGHTSGGASLAEWTSQNFATAEALVFVGAAGIAVRAVAPYCQSKASDPAVVVVDECGRFAVPLLSGHLGGANRLARSISHAIGAVSVITTATDANGVFAVDEWAKMQGCIVAEPGRIKAVSGALLAGKTVTCASEFLLQGEVPQGVQYAKDASPDFALCVHTVYPGALHIIPRICVLGIGCKRGTTQQTLEQELAFFCERNRLDYRCICTAASIDLKQGEAGLLAFCTAHGWATQFYSAAQLLAVPGSFTSSAFVRSVTGVDNVCERAAAAQNAKLIVPKYAHGGVTFALAMKPYTPNWRWNDAE